MEKNLLMTVTTGALRLASWVVCLVVLLSFVIFAVSQAGQAATKQADEIAPTPNLAPVVSGPASTAASALSTAAGSVTSSAGSSGSQPGPSASSLKGMILRAGNTLSGPFARITGSSSPWVQHGIATLLVLLIFGVGVGFVVRTLRLLV